MRIVLSFVGVMMAFMTLAESNGLELSVKFFEAVKNKSDKADDYYAQLGGLNAEELSEELNSDEKILAFWINIYNTSVQYILREDPSKFDDRGAFFKAKQVKIAGEVLSLDRIEHGILRRSKTKWSLGYFSKIFVPKYERIMRINKVDPRIHYALNCGAKSCPPIAAYHWETVDQELDASVQKYLRANCEVTENKLLVPVLFSWFRADFGGQKGVKKFLLRYDIIQKADKKKDLKYKDYDWTLALDPYYEE